VLSVFYIFYMFLYVLFFCMDSGITHSLYTPSTGDDFGEFLVPQSIIYQKYKGPLPVQLIIAGKISLALTWFLISWPIAIIITLALCPLSPFFLLPLTIFGPTLPTSLKTKFLAFCLGLILDGIIFIILFFQYSIQLKICIIVLIIIGILWSFCIYSPPTSDWAFLGCLWVGVGAPIAHIIGLQNPVNPELNPFTGPVPFPSIYSTLFQKVDGHITL